MSVRKLAAEFIGTALLVIFAVGAATLSFGFGLTGASTSAGVITTAMAFGLVLVGLARAGAPTVLMAGRLTAIADASWVLASAALLVTDTFSVAGDVIVVTAAVPVALLGIGKVVALRSSPDRREGLAPAVR